MTRIVGDPKPPLEEVVNVVDEFSHAMALGEDFLEHFGIKGMKWGVHRSGSGRSEGNPGGASNATNKQAKKDAEEFTKAKLFYGQGAGTRRKLIKAKVEAASKKDPTYKAAFDHHVANTDLGKRAEQATKTRRRKDVTSGTAKTARGVKNVLAGNSRAANTTAVVAVAAGTYAHNSGADKAVFNATKKFVRDAHRTHAMKKGHAFLKSAGLVP